MEEIRVNKYLSELGVCSRREADRLIESSKVKINGNTVIMGEKVNPGEIKSLVVDGKEIKQEKPESIIIAYNKPVGVECTADKSNKDNIIDAIGFDKRLIYMGRLDKNSHGLMLLTTDGELVNKLMRAANFKEKEYIVKVNKKIDDDFIEKMSKGVPILDTVTRECKVWKISNTSFGIILTQGLNRQIRRMCEYFGVKVFDLKRVRVENITLEGLKEGEYRVLSKKETCDLKSIINK